MSIILKKIFYELSEQSHIAYWEKAGLPYPEDRLVEERNEGEATEDNRMAIEDSDNLFAEYFHVFTVSVNLVLFIYRPVHGQGKIFPYFSPVLKVRDQIRYQIQD